MPMQLWGYPYHEFSTVFFDSNWFGDGFFTCFQICNGLGYYLTDTFQSFLWQWL
jgi:hypothetical protein